MMAAGGGPFAGTAFIWGYQIGVRAQIAASNGDGNE